MILSVVDSFPPQPGIPPWPGVPSRPDRPPPPGVPSRPGLPPGVPSRPDVAPPPVLAPVRVWPDPSPWPGRVYERLFERRIVLAHGELDDEAATSLCAQLLTLDAERNEPIRLEITGLSAELGAALTVMGVLDVLRVPVRACAGGQIGGPALGVLAAATVRHAYPNAVFQLSEPQLGFEGSATSLNSREEQVRGMMDALYLRLADVTGHEADEIRADARRGRYLTVDEAIGYGLIQGLAAAP
ncbi:MAG TPA: ATP-dependent Clp protease proteolytic subunit [Streptosporangiaceae bacterium]|nr:ATP-dependent Clp protease proteolytic subunit [Streptosporangiaceae bacterium]